MELILTILIGIGLGLATGGILEFVVKSLKDSIRNRSSRSIELALTVTAKPIVNASILLWATHSYYALVAYVIALVLMFVILYTRALKNVKRTQMERRLMYAGKGEGEKEEIVI